MKRIIDLGRGFAVPELLASNPKKTRHYCYHCHTIVTSGHEKSTCERLGHDVDQISQEQYEKLEQEENIHD